MPWDLSPVDLVLIVLAVLGGTLAQGSVGMGVGLVVVPALAIIEPGLLPAVPILVAMPLTILIAVRERQSIDRGGIPLLMVGRVLGTMLAVLLLTSLSESALEMLFGIVVLGVVGLSIRLPRIDPTPPAKLAASTVSGLFATTAAIGGPPLALLYQHRSGPEIRSTLNVVFLLGGIIALIGLVAADRLSLWHVGIAALLFPATLAGFALSRPLGRFLDRGWLRPTVLAFAAGGAIFAIVRSLTG